MSDAFVKWCRASTPAATFIDRVDKFKSAGISLTTPAGGVVVLLDVDGDGIATTTSELASLIDRRIGTSITFEWWFSADNDLTCTYTFVPGKREIQTFYLDGLSPQEAATISDLLQELFEDQPGPSDWLVADTRGNSADFNWDDYLQYGVGAPAEPPDVLIISNSMLKARSDLPNASVATAAEADFVKIGRQDWVR